MVVMNTKHKFIGIVPIMSNLVEGNDELTLGIPMGI
jgi:hypothetical protein